GHVNEGGLAEEPALDQAPQKALDQPGTPKCPGGEHPMGASHNRTPRAHCHAHATPVRVKPHPVVVNDVSLPSLFEATVAESRTPVSDAVRTERLRADTHSAAQFENGRMQRSGSSQKRHLMPSGGEARAERRHAGDWSARAFPEPSDRVQDLHLPLQHSTWRGGGG